jgi:hypothetical protein
LKHFAHSTKGGHFEKDKLGFIRQLINIQFCAYPRRLEIADPLLKMNAKTYTRQDTVPQRVITKNEP